MSSNTPSEEGRILAQTAERARLAAAARIAELNQAGAAPAQAAPAAEGAGASDAAQFLGSVPPVPRPDETASLSKAALRKTARNWKLFLCLVVGPVLAVAVYLTSFATPLYEARSVVAITKSSDAEAGSPNGLLGGLGDASRLQEVFRADRFIQSQALMETLEADLGFVSEVSGPAIDPVRRLRPLPFLSSGARDQFDRFVDSSIDIQSGLMTLYVRAPSAERAIEVSEAVVRSAERQVSELDQALFNTRQTYATDMRTVAEAQLQTAQAKLVELQFQHQEVDPKARVESIYNRIRELEDERQRLDGEVQEAQIAGFGDSPQTQKLVALDAHLRDEITREREKLVSPDGSSATPLNILMMEHEMALLEVDLARQAVESAIEAQAEAGREAALNRSLLQVVVPPSTSDAPAYPRIPGILALCLVICLTTFAAVSNFVGNRR